jgi:hypothetical protein
MAKRDMASYAIHHVQKNVALGRQIKAALIKEFGEDDDLIADMIEGETNLDMWLPSLFDAREDCRTMIAANKAHQQRLKDRQEQLEKREATFKKVISEALMLCPDKKVETIYGLRYMAKARKVLIIDDENKIPTKWYDTPEPPDPKPRKRDIEAAIKKGTNVPGCRLDYKDGREYNLTER